MQFSSVQAIYTTNIFRCLLSSKCVWRNWLCRSSCYLNVTLNVATHESTSGVDWQCWCKVVEAYSASLLLPSQAPPVCFFSSKFHSSHSSYWTYFLLYFSKHVKRKFKSYRIMADSFKYVCVDKEILCVCKYPSLVDVFFFCIYLNVNVAWLSFWDFFKKKHWRFLTGTPRWSDFCSVMFFDVCFSLFSQLITAQSQFSLSPLSLFLLSSHFAFVIDEECEEVLRRPTERKKQSPTYCCSVEWDEGGWSSYQYPYWWLQWKLLEMFCFPIDLWSIMSC